MTSENRQSRAIRTEYERHGVNGFYQEFGDDYRNPHEEEIRLVLSRCLDQWSLDLSDVLDLACGSGEATLALVGCGAKEVTGVDPYTARAYQRRTARAAESFTFEQIAAGANRFFIDSSRHRESLAATGRA